MACDQWRSKLDLYVDGELAPADANALGAHLRECAACAADTLERVQLKRAVLSAGRSYEASAALRSRITQSVAKPRLGFNLGWKWASAVAALLLLVAGTYTYVSREDARRMQLYGELADLHVATLGSANPVDVVSSDRHTVKPWFQGKIPFTFNLPELQGAEFTLVGGRVAYFEQTAGAHLIYQYRKHQISVFIFPEHAIALPSLPSGPANQLSFTLESWSRNGLRYFVVGDAGADTIRALSDLLRSAQ